MAKIRKALISVDSTSEVEKYRQLVAGVIKAVGEGRIRRGEALPTVNALCQEFGLAKETVLKAYAILRERGIVKAVPRKGYFLATESVDHTAKVLLLFDEFSSYKQVLYDAFVHALRGRAQTDILFHHCSPKLFESLLLDNVKSCDMAVVMPFDDEAVGRALRRVDPRKVLILDRREYADGGFPFIGQEFEASVYRCLGAARELLRKYRTFHLVFPAPAQVAIKSSQAPAEIVRGFRKFCRENRIRHGLLHEVGAHAMAKGDAFFVIDDADLVTVVEMARARGLTCGKDVGVLSYNDAPVKRVIDRGITVISTDFAELGRLAARHVLDPRPVAQVVPTCLIRRESL